MRRGITFPTLVLAVAIIVPWRNSAFAQQNTTGTINGAVTDTANEALPGARVVLTPGNITLASDLNGGFRINGVAPGKYVIAVSYVGFSRFSKTVTVATGQATNVNVVLHLVSQKQEVVVTSRSAHGMVAALNLERTTTNILDVLPASVISALPNSNIADAVGRLPSVTLERDEGEGKYVQIRGTEPRLSNLTIDGVEVPSPEGGIRQVKLDTVPADLVHSVQVFKTLQADQPGDAIGGSVNLQTKTAGNRPTGSAFATGGFTPIDNTVPVMETGATLGTRFGAQHRLGVIVSGSLDYNGRGIDDIEPVPGFNSIDNSFEFTNMDVRDYLYQRKRWGIGGNADYRLGRNSTLYLRTLYSVFHDYGYRNDYALAANDTIPGTNLPTLTTEKRLGNFHIGDIILGGDHTRGPWNLNWEASVARSEMLNPINGDESITTFSFIPSTSNCQYNAAATKHEFLPQFTPACFSEMYDPSNWALSDISQDNHGRAEQVNLQGSASMGRSYMHGNTSGVFQFGFWFSNAHKFDDSWQNDFVPNGTVLANQFLGPFINKNYYGGNIAGISSPYGAYGPWISWDPINSYYAANPSAFTASTTFGGNSNNFDLLEHVIAGYMMNTLTSGRLTLVTGIRFEGTQDDTLSWYTELDQNGNLVKQCLCNKGHNAYMDPLPSASLAIKLDNQSDVRLAYGRGISRPDPQYLSGAATVDRSYDPGVGALITIGNTALKAEHANDVDVLYERYMAPVGVIRAGFFYKNLTDPQVQTQSAVAGNYSQCQTYGVTPCFVNQASNGGSAYIAGLELSFEQHFTDLPGPLKGFGILANYSYAGSQAHNVSPGNRTDSPALLRQARNAWNIWPTYHIGRFTANVGLSYNGPNIASYGYVSGAQGGIKGPFGDNYFYAHLEADAQGEVYLGRGVTALVSVYNFNNDVFGFYNGSPQFFVQREYYHPTYSFGLRWDLGRER